MATYIAASGGPKIDGSTLLDSRGLNRWMQGFTQTPRPPFSLQGVATGKTIQEFMLRDNGTDWKPSQTYWQWQAQSGAVDPTALELLRERFSMTQAHTMVTGVRDYVRADTDGTRNVLLLDRQVLGDTYSRVNQLGVNGGAAAVDIQIKNHTGAGPATYTIAYGAGVPAAGTVNIDITTAGLEWKRMTFAPADIAGLGSVVDAFIIRAVWLYRVALTQPPETYDKNGNTEDVGFPQYTITELGEPDA